MASATKALVLNGMAKDEDGVSEILATELNHLGYEVETLTLRDRDIAPCLGCFGCWVKTPGMCVVGDEGRDVVRMAVQSDLMVFLTPVTFGGYSSILKKALDRIIPIISPFFMTVGGEIHHRPRYARYPTIVGVGILPQPDEESERIFKTLVSRNAINAHSPSHTAGIVIKHDPPSKMSDGIKRLLDGLGVSQ
jgi:multimeric flavodoxin WrbA